MVSRQKNLIYITFYNKFIFDIFIKTKAVHSMLLISSSSDYIAYLTGTIEYFNCFFIKES